MCSKKIEVCCSAAVKENWVQCIYSAEYITVTPTNGFEFVLINGRNTKNVLQRNINKIKIFYLKTDLRGNPLNYH